MRTTYHGVGAALALITGLLLCADAGAQLPLSEQAVLLANELDINSAGTDYPVAVYGGGVVYASTQTDPRLKRRLKTPRRGARALERLLFAEPDTEGILDPVRSFMAGFGGKVNAGPAAFTSGGDVAYVTRNAGPVRSSGSRVASRLQIYETALGADGAWGPLRPVEFAGGTSNDAHPTLAAGDSWLVFASDRDGGYGGLDLWGVRRTGGMWGAPFNLGPDVNTGGNEAYPFLHADGTLYYATTVAGTRGGPPHYDIAFSVERDGKWGEPTFLGPPFNTPADDFALLVDSANRGGYLASGRQGGLGGDDIYRFEVVGYDGGGRRAKAELAVAVSDAETGLPLQGASVVYLDADTTTLASALSREVITVDGMPLQVVGGERYMTDVRGEGIIRIREGTFLLEVAREGYEPLVLSVAVAPGQTRVPVMLTPKLPCVEVRVSVVEEATVFPVGSALLAAVAEKGLGRPVEARTGDDGTVLMCLPCGQVYSLNAVAGALQGLPVVYDTRDAQCGRGAPRTTLTVYLADRRNQGLPTGGALAIAEGTPLAAGTKFQMPAVYYGLGDYTLNDAAKADLDDLGRLMQQFPEMDIELGSHTDANGPAAFNRDLSQRRADQARRYLMAVGGVEPQRIIAVGYGESRLRNGCSDGVSCSPALHRENRRTEVTILGEGVPSGLDAALASVASSPPPPSRRRVGRPTAPEEAPGVTLYYVISGVFARLDTAMPSLDALRALGYSDARIEEVPGIRGYAIVGGRFERRSTATQFARALDEAHGREAYVRRVGP